MQSLSRFLLLLVASCLIYPASTSVVVLSHICRIDICHADPVLSCRLGSRCAPVEERLKKSLSSVFKAGPRCFSLCSTSTFLSLAGKIPSNTICARHAFQHLCRILFLKDQGKHVERLFISGPTERLHCLCSNRGNHSSRVCQSACRNLQFHGYDTDSLLSVLTVTFKGRRIVAVCDCVLRVWFKRMVKLDCKRM